MYMRVQRICSRNTWSLLWKFSKIIQSKLLEKCKSGTGIQITAWFTLVRWQILFLNCIFDHLKQHCHHSSLLNIFYNIIYYIIWDCIIMTWWSTLFYITCVVSTISVVNEYKSEQRYCTCESSLYIFRSGEKMHEVQHSVLFKKS